MKNLNKILLGFVLVVGVVSVVSLLNRNSNPTSEEVNINSVSAIEFAELAKNEDAFLLDVHIPEQTHIPGTDAFIPFNELAENTSKLPEDKSTQILVYCRSGSMSRQAAYELQEM